MPSVFSRFAAPTALFWALILLAVDADQTTNITNSPYTDSWDGWGVSLAWWANVFGDREDLADVVFSRNSTHWGPGEQTLPGLGLNIVRYNAGASSWNKVNGSVSMAASPKIPSSKQIPGYWLDGQSTDPSSGSWNWTVDANQRSMMLKAQSRGADTFELFSNSPMWWQLSNRNPSGGDKGGSNLPSSQYENHAIYLSTIAKYAQDHWGVTFNSIDPFNEPAATWWSASGSQEGCHFDANSQKALIPILRQQMQARGLSKTVLAASDENSYSAALDTWNTIGKAAEQANVTRVNVHGYSKTSGPRDQLREAVSSAGQKLWNSEYGDNDEVGETAVKSLMMDLKELRPSAWVYWQILDAGGWGLINANLDSKTLSNATHKYFELAQFTRHIRPGMQILESNSDNVIPAIDQKSNTLVIVAANWNGTQKLNFDLSAFSQAPAEGTKVRSWVTDRAGSNLYASYNNLTVEHRGLSASFENGTVQTFEISGVHL